MDGSDPRKVLDSAAKAVRDTAEVVQTTTESIAVAIETERRRGGVLDQLANLTRGAPLRSLAIAFVTGFIFAYRR